MQKGTLVFFIDADGATRPALVYHVAPAHEAPLEKVQALDQTTGQSVIVAKRYPETVNLFVFDERPYDRQKVAEGTAPGCYSTTEGTYAPAATPAPATASSQGATPVSDMNATLAKILAKLEAPPPAPAPASSPVIVPPAPAS